MNHQSWKQLEYRNLKPNTISTIKDNGEHLKISVSDSASPLIYKFEQAKKLKSFHIKATILQGNLNFKNIKQGDKQADDFVLRVGLVAKGNRTLNLWHKISAPRWISELYKMAKDGEGIDKIYFYNVASDNLNWNERVHPLSELISEKIVGKIVDNKIDVKVNLDGQKDYLGIWISSDGDDTKSKFEISIDEIQLEEL